MELKYFCKFCSSEPRALRCSRRGAPFGGAVLGILGTPGLVCATREEPCPEDAARPHVSVDLASGRFAQRPPWTSGPRRSPRGRAKAPYTVASEWGHGVVASPPGPRLVPPAAALGPPLGVLGGGPPHFRGHPACPALPPCTRPVPPAAPACALPSAGLAHPTLSSYLRERRPHPGCQLDLQQRNLCDAPRGLMKTLKATSP